MPTLIDPSGLTKIGNMTTNGIGQLFDSNTGTNAYNAATSGYAGVTFAVPTKISHVEIDSQSNGFDASGSTTSITLKLYAKTGAAPSTRTDGTLLATVGPFTDINSLTTKTLTSSDQTTQYAHCWVSVETGVWSAATEIRIYAVEDIPVDEPEAINSERYTLKSVCDTAVQLGYQYTEIPDFEQNVLIETAALAKLSLRFDIEHRGSATGYTNALSLGCRIKWQRAVDYVDLDTATENQMDNVVAGRNLCERTPQHYETLHVTGALELEAGYFYRFKVYANAATDATGWTTTNGLAHVLVENSKGLNMFLTEIDHGAVLVDMNV